MSYDNNIYYNPESAGLKTVAELELDNESYQFNLIVVWKRLSDGKLYMGQDSGCSCPSPFEDYNDVEQLAEFNTKECQAAITNARDGYASGPDANEVESFWRLVNAEQGC